MALDSIRAIPRIGKVSAIIPPALLESEPSFGLLGFRDLWNKEPRINNLTDFWKVGIGAAWKMQPLSNGFDRSSIRSVQ